MSCVIAVNFARLAADDAVQIVFRTRSLPTVSVGTRHAPASPGSTALVPRGWGTSGASERRPQLPFWCRRTCSGRTCMVLQVGSLFAGVSPQGVACCRREGAHSSRRFGTTRGWQLAPYTDDARCCRRPTFVLGRRGWSGRWGLEGARRCQSGARLPWWAEIGGSWGLLGRAASSRHRLQCTTSPTRRRLLPVCLWGQRSVRPRRQMGRP